MVAREFLARDTGRPQIKAILFDFDGVLLESAEVKTRAFVKIFEPIAPHRMTEVVAYHTAHMGISRYVKFRYIYEQILKRPLSHG